MMSLRGRPSSLSMIVVSASRCWSGRRLVANAAWIHPETGVFRHWTDNSFVDLVDSNSNSRQQQHHHAVINPATQEPIGTIVDPTGDELHTMVQKAVTAYHSWKTVPLAQRQRVFFAFQHLIRQHQDELAYWITLENGKTLTDAAGDVFRGLEVVETACHVAPHYLGTALSNIATHMDCTSIRRPLGVTLGICPFNFPAMIPLWMFPLAIVCGNAMILKPSERTPSAALRLAELAALAGLPKNVLQVIHGGRHVVQSLCHAPDIAAVSFVGSTAAGHAVADAAATGSNKKRVQANLGAKNHAIVLPPSSSPHDTVPSIAKAISGAAFGAAGQRCMALSVVIFVGTATKEMVLPEIIRVAQSLKVGAGMEPGVDVGPVISDGSKYRILSILRDAEASSSTTIVRLDGRGVTVPDYPHGNFIGPTIIEVDSTDNVAYMKEIFGPVLTVLCVDTLDEAIALVNANPYGNGCSIFTSSGGAARHFVNAIECGQVGVNVPIPVPLPAFSFTGNKASIRGDLNFYGAAGVQFYTQLQTVTSHWAYDHDATELGGVNMPTMGQKHL